MHMDSRPEHVAKSVGPVWVGFLYSSFGRGGGRTAPGSGLTEGFPGSKVEGMQEEDRVLQWFSGARNVVKPLVVLTE